MVFNVTVVHRRSAGAFTIRHMHKLLSSLASRVSQLEAFYCLFTMNILLTFHLLLCILIKLYEFSLVFSPKYEICIRIGEYEQVCILVGLIGRLGILKCVDFVIINGIVLMHSVMG